MREPDRPRPYKGPGTLRVAGREVPLFAVLGGLGTGLAFVTVTLLHMEVALAGLGWLALGVLLYVIYRRRQGLDLVTTTKIAIPGPVTEREVEYESVLVAFDERGYLPEAVGTATRLAAKRRRGIHVLVTITVPASSPINSPLPEQEIAAQAIIEQARLDGGSRVTGHYEKVRAGQAGRVIVERAKETRARAIVLPLPQRRAGGALFGKTLELVLSERPCRVVIVTPAGEGRRGTATHGPTTMVR
jgi:APA family basic amino acid/polyamine antiporter